MIKRNGFNGFPAPLLSGWWGFILHLGYGYHISLELNKDPGSLCDVERMNEGVLISVRPWVLGFLKPGDPAAPVPALETLSGFPPGCVALNVSLVLLSLPQAGEHRAWTGN